jgi:L-fucose mutarotase
MLKKIPDVISPELLKILCEMGHGDEIVLGDGNFPAASCANILTRADGIGIPRLLDTILQLFPLDSFVENPVNLMKKVPGDKSDVTIWDEYKKIIKKYDNNAGIGFIERFEFYERTKKAYAVVATGESALYANIILKKGVIKP